MFSHVTHGFTPETNNANIRKDDLKRIQLCKLCMVLSSSDVLDHIITLELWKTYKRARIHYERISLSYSHKKAIYEKWKQVSSTKK